MIRTDKIISSLYSGVGWNQTPTNLITDGYPTLDSDNLTSESGLRFQNSSNFVTIQNIYDTQQDVNISDADFNTLLDNMQNDVIINNVNKILIGESDYISSINLYPFEKTFDETIEPGNRFKAFKIEKNNSGIIGKISFLEVCFDSEVTFNIYLYNSNLKAPIKTKEVTTSANEAKIIDISEWYLDDDTTFKGGNYYIGYFESDLGGAKPIKRNYELANYQICSPYFYIQPISLSYTGSVINIKNEQSESDTGGLNIGINIYTDYTEFIIRNKNLFWQSIQLGMAEKVLNQSRTSVRSNYIERITKDFINQIGFELYGNRELGIDGIEGRLEREIKDIKKMLFYKPRIIRKTIA